jgi:hypothetical protein
VEVLYCQVTGHAKALVPAGAGLAPGTEFKVQIGTGFDRPFASQNGQKIFFTGLANLVATEDECYIVVDNFGTSAATVAREGTAFGSPTGDLLALGDQRMGINANGHFVFGVDTNALAAVDKFVIKWDGAAFVTVAREGDLIPGSATETWGNGMNSGHIMADGNTLFCAVDTGGVNPTTSDDYCMVGNVIFIQTGNNIAGAQWDAFNSSDFWMTSDGAHSMMVGDDNTPTTQDRILVVDAAVKVREGVPLPGSGFASNVSASFGTSVENLLFNDGSYMIHGSNADGIDWAYRNGAVVAKTDDPIVPASTELFDDTLFSTTFFTIAGNAVGHSIVGGTTNAVDVNNNAVLVLDGTRIVLRENDMVDLNGNGLADDDAFIATFNNDDCFLTDDLKLVFFADVRNALLVSLGQMVLKVDLNLCHADIAPPGGDGAVGIADLLRVIQSWGHAFGDPADINDDGIVNIADLLQVIATWGACPT